MKQLYIILIFVISFMFCGCEEKPEAPKEVKQMTLIYAVNHNNLSSDLVANQEQMLNAMVNIDPEVYKLLVYKYTSDGPALFEVIKTGGKAEFNLLKQYDNSRLSVTKDRISEVIHDALDLYPGVESNLFFWGHGLGWVNPDKYPNTVSKSKVASGATTDCNENTISMMLPEMYGYGGEYVYEDGVRVRIDYLDLDQLAEAIPDNVFDMIWFDCCYMSGIEVAYQLRDKCNYLVAYPTEIMAEGLPYSQVLPKILNSSKDKAGAAQSLYDYYIGKNVPEPVTVAVMDMSQIESVADAASEIFKMGERRPSVTGMQNYSRLRSTPYYDFGQYMREYADANVSPDSGESAESLKAMLKSALEKFVLFAAASEKDFTYPVAKPINKENFSGLSIHNYLNIDSAREDYYRKLDWNKRVRATDVK